MKKLNKFFGRFGGGYVPEVLIAPLLELEEAYKKYIEDRDFIGELTLFSKEFIGRPTPLLFAKNSTEKLGGANIYIKLEGLANTGAHKINNAVGQALLAKKMGKTRIIAETGAGQHGVAVAAACARLGLDCIIYMGEIDIERQHPNVFWMELYGAKVVTVKSGSKTLKDAVNEALRDWTGSFENTHYIIGSALGPAPYPDMVREFQSVIGKEVKEQSKDFEIDTMIACVGGGSNAIGFFEPFIESDKPKLIGVEAGGRGFGIGENAIRMSGNGKDGIVQGYKSKFLTSSDGQLLDTHSISAGLDYPGIGPQLARLGETGRISFTSANDQEAIDALKFFARNEGVVFAMESAHGGAVCIKLAKKLPKGKNIIINMSGRGDKDIFISAKAIDEKPWKEFLKKESKDE